jgi:hypothetical protein
VGKGESAEESWPRSRGERRSFGQTSAPREFGAFIAADTAKWVDLVAKTNMKAN